MNLGTLLSQVNVVKVTGPTSPDITSISHDSRSVQPGALFVALKGANSDGRQYVDDAIARGAVAVVAEENLSLSNATTIVVANARAALADFAQAFFDYPARSLKIVGVTGTNGKTTTTFLVKHICDQALMRCGMIGTVRYDIGDDLVPASRTTPESSEIQELLWKMLSRGCKAAAMEVSSHALCQERVRGIGFDVGIFTNLTQDHLDYHGTMEAYFDAKVRLFESLSTGKKPGTAVVNMDDRYGQMLIRRIGSSRPLVTYGRSTHAQFRASNVRIDFHGSSYQLDANGKSYLVRLPLIGSFNVYNSLGAIAAANALGISIRSAILALANAPAVPGRLQPVAGQRAFRVFVDYAHTDDALINVIEACRELNPARLIVVFGAGGNRDRSKRPKMGAAVDRLADWAIVTSDNPRREAPEAIIEDIRKGMTKANHEVIIDRAEAISKAIAMARPRDVVLIAGKGHENYQEIGDERIAFDDVLVAERALGERRSDQPR